MFISLLAVSWSGNHPLWSVICAVFGGSFIGVFLAIQAKISPSLLKSKAVWAEPAVVILLSPAFLFPSRNRIAILGGILIVFFLHFFQSGKFAEFNPSLLPVALLLLMVLVSLYATYDIQQSLPKVAGILFGIMAFISLGNSVVDRRAVLLLLAGFLLGGFLLACVGVLGTQWFSKVPFLAGISSHLPAVIRGLPGAEEGFQPNGVAGSLILFIPLQVVILLQLRHEEKGERLKKIFLAILGFSLLFTGGVVVLTQSRGGWLGLAAGLMLLFGWKSRLGKWLGGMVVVIGAAALIWLGPKKIGDAVMTSIGSSTGVTSSYEGRLEVWNRALYGISDFPITGMGMNTFRKVVHVLYPLFLSSPDTDIAHCHNQILQTTLDLGIPGLVAYAALLAAAIAMGIIVWRKSKDPWFRVMSQGIICGLLAQQVFGISDAIALGAKTGIFFWVALGILAAMFRLTKQEEIVEKTREVL